MPSLDGKVSLVTGGTSGIGLAAANALAREGSHVYITGRRERELATAVQQIGSNVTGVQGDVSNAQDLDRLFAQITDEKGKLDILFANAGIAKYAALGNITEDLYDSIVDVNVKGVLFTVQKALPLMPDGASIKHRRIRVNAISPGTIDTPGLNDLLASGDAGEQRRKMVASAIPLGRFGQPDEVAKAVVFLASDDSSYVTGVELFVDGGFAQV